ncbi:hypothetical protein [Parafrankia elaeagni]|uniref:hypothetical protein n=1 Tax=Parafrankia elaeagni TaxID=222534 RepID=UPI000363FE2A|nr:hypothetical protein [Parafrankia elaeagni]
MTTEHPIDVPTLTQHLRKAMRHGVRATRLATHAPHLVDLLTPSHTGSPDERAIAAEQIIRDAIEPLGTDVSAAMRIMLGLEPGTWHNGIEDRRKRAAKRIGITPGAFRRPRREGTYLHDIAWEIWQQRRKAA